jgi:Flp pilus assembly protein TadG
MVTAETAVVLPVLLLVLAAAVSALMVVGAQLRCVDAAREGARAAARGEADDVVLAVVGRGAPAGAAVTAQRAGGIVTVEVTAPVRPLGPLPLRLTVSATASGEVEPAAGDDP